MSKKFWKFYKIYISIFIIISIMIFITLWLFLSSYEKSEPSNIILSVTKMFEHQDLPKIKKYLEIKNRDINTDEIIDELLLDKLNIKELSYEKSNDNEEQLKYYIKNGSNKIATVKLKESSKKGFFNLKRYEISKIDDLLPQEKTINIIAPKGYDIYLYNNKLSDQYLVDDNYLTDELNNINKYTEIDALNKYTIEDIYKEAEIKSAINDQEVEVIKKENNYFVKFKSNEELLKSVESDIKDFCINYTRYVVNEQGFQTISSYVIPSSNANIFLRNIANTNKWMNNHTPSTFSDINLENMQQYNDNAFSIDVNYTYSYKVLGKEKKYDTNLTLYLIKEKNEWKIADLTV